MLRTEFISTGFSVPDRVLTNDDLKQWWDTSDEWIRERSGIEQRHWVEPGQQAGQVQLEEQHRLLDARSTPDPFIAGIHDSCEVMVGVGFAGQILPATHNGKTRHR